VGGVVAVGIRDFLAKVAPLLKNEFTIILAACEFRELRSSAGGAA
jgi:hypothetical protein